LQAQGPEFKLQHHHQTRKKRHLCSLREAWVYFTITTTLREGAQRSPRIWEPQLGVPPEYHPAAEPASFLRRGVRPTMAAPTGWRCRASVGRGRTGLRPSPCIWKQGAWPPAQQMSPWQRHTHTSAGHGFCSARQKGHGVQTTISAGLGLGLSFFHLS
jgi:hypothetical protein